MLDHRQILLATDPVQRASVLVLSVFAHLVVLALLVVFPPKTTIRIVPEKFETAQMISGAGNLSFHSTNASPRRPHPSPSRLVWPAHVAERRAVSNGAAGQALRKTARHGTAEIVMNLKFRQIYGFSPLHDYQVAFWMAGEFPSISAADLPPHFEQLLTVEITIDVDGRVAEARVVAGMVPPTVEQKLLSAIREFKYSPAKRDGIPIPSQLDLVIHIPT